MNTEGCVRKMFYQLFRPLIFLQNPEKAHDRVIKFGEYFEENDVSSSVSPFFHYENKKLNTNVFGIDFKNPIGLAAGFDKNAVSTKFIEWLNFGFEEIGSVTAMGGVGNEKPRVFRLTKDKAIINRMGLNNEGAYPINKNLRKRKSKFPIGVNIAKTHSPYIMGDEAIDDFKFSYRAMREGDYVVLNISCPNTKEGKTFEDPVVLKELLSEINALRGELHDERPLLAKLSPDNEDRKKLEGILYVCENQGIGGYILSNTSSRRKRLVTSQNYIDKIGAGGLSGVPLQKDSNDLISFVYNQTSAPIIGVGGVFTANDAYDKIKSGASLVQGLTGFVYNGPGFAKNINKGLVKLLERDGFSNISEAVGANCN